MLCICVCFCIPEYRYAERWPRDRVLAAVHKIREEEAKEHAEIERIATERRKAIEDFDAMALPFVQRAESMLEQLKATLHELVVPYLQVVHEETGFEEFIVGGSWASAKIAEAMATICCDDPMLNCWQMIWTSTTATSQPRRAHLCRCC